MRLPNIKCNTIWDIFFISAVTIPLHIRSLRDSFICNFTSFILKLSLSEITILMVPSTAVDLSWGWDWPNRTSKICVSFVFQWTIYHFSFSFWIFFRSRLPPRGILPRFFATFIHNFFKWLTARTIIHHILASKNYLDYVWLCVYVMLYVQFEFCE